MFTGSDAGTALRATNWRKRVFDPALIEAGLYEAMTPHDLRDTAATLAFANGATVKEVSRMLGHSRAAVTLDRYTGVLESSEQATSEALDAAFQAAQDAAPAEATVTAIRG